MLGKRAGEGVDHPPIGRDVSRRGEACLLEHFRRPTGKVHLAPLANRADVDELQARPTVQVLAQIGDEPLLDGQIAIVPENRIDLLLRIEALERHRRHALVEDPLGRDVLAAGVHVLRHEAEGDTPLPSLDPQVENGTEVLVETVLPLCVRLKHRPVLSEVADLDQRREPGIGGQVIGVKRSIEVEAHAGVDQRC